MNVEDMAITFGDTEPHSRCFEKEFDDDLYRFRIDRLQRRLLLPDLETISFRRLLKIWTVECSYCKSPNHSVYDCHEKKLSDSFSTILNNGSSTMLQRIDTDSLIRDLKSNGVRFSPYESICLHVFKASGNRNSIILNKIKREGSGLYETFKVCLVTSGQPHLFDYLLKLEHRYIYPFEIERNERRRDTTFNMKKQAEHVRWVRFGGEPKINLQSPRKAVISGSGSCDSRDQFCSESSSPDKDGLFGDSGQTPEEAMWCYSSQYMLATLFKLFLFLHGNCKLQRKTLVLFVFLTLSTSATAEHNTDRPYGTADFAIYPCSSLLNLLLLCLCCIGIYMNAGYFQTGLCAVNQNGGVAFHSKTVAKNASSGWWNGLDETISVNIDENDETDQPKTVVDYLERSSNTQENREDKRPERFKATTNKYIETIRKRKLPSVLDETFDHNNTVKERRIVMVSHTLLKRKIERPKRKRLEDIFFEDVEHNKQVKKRMICIACHTQVKRKMSDEIEYTKRKRLDGVTSRPSDDDFDYCEFIQAFSLKRKRSVSTKLVLFLIELMQQLKRFSLEKIEECVYTFTEDEMTITKDRFVEDECVKIEVSQHIHKSSHSTTLATEDDDIYELPGIDYEIFPPLLKPKGHIEKFLLCGGRNTLDFDQLNEVVYTLKSDYPNEMKTSQQLNEERKSNQHEREKQIKIVTVTASAEQLEQPYIEKVQEALYSADVIRDKTFINLEYKMLTTNPLQENKFIEYVGTHVHTQKKALLEDTKEGLYRKLELPQPQIDPNLLQIIALPAFDPVLTIIDQIANGTPPTPHISMRYELLRFCTLRSYPKENKPYLIKLAEAGFYYASDGDGVVCYCCGVRRYNWVAEDNPMKIHERINPNCKFLRKNADVNVPVKYFGPFGRALVAIMNIPEPRERQEHSEDVNNDWAPERIRSPAPAQQNRQVETGANSLGINTAIPKHSQYATKTAREGSYSGWPDSASHTPQELADGGFFYAGFGDCVRCFFCGIGLRHWTKEDNPWIEHARWSRNCVFVKQKKGEEFVNLVQLAVQYSQDNETQGNATAGNQLPAQEIERVLLSDAAQSVLEMGYQPRIIKKAIEHILRHNDSQKITAQFLMEEVLKIEEAETPPQTASVSNAIAAAHTKSATVTADKEGVQSGNTERKDKKNEIGNASTEDKHKSTDNATNNLESTTGTQDQDVSQDPKAIKAENEQLKEQTLCKVCLDNTVCIVFLPCGHLVTCADCAPAMRKCPICRALVKGTVRTYMS